MTSEDRHRDRDVTAQTLEALLHAITNRLTEVTIAKVRGRQGRKGTRHWTPPAGQPMSTKALDPSTVVDPDLWRQQVEQAAWQVLGPAGVAAGNRLRQKLHNAGVQPATTQTVPPEQAPLNQTTPPPPPPSLPQGDGPEAHPIRDYAIWKAVRWLGDAGAGKARELHEKIAAAEQADIDKRTAGALEAVRRVAAESGSSVEPIVGAIRDWQVGPDGTSGLASWARTRAEAATTATVQGVHHGLLVNLPPNVTVTRTWQTRKDNRVRDAHRIAEGQTVDGDEPFIVGGERLRYPGDPTGSPGNVINCRCHAPYRITVDPETKDLVRTPAGADFYDEPIGTPIAPHPRPHAGHRTAARPGALPENVEAVAWTFDREDQLAAVIPFMLGGLGGRDEHGIKPEGSKEPYAHFVSNDDRVEAKKQVAAELAARMTAVSDEDLLGVNLERATDPNAVWRRDTEGRWRPYEPGNAADEQIREHVRAGRWDQVAAMVPLGPPQDRLGAGGPAMVARLREQAVSDLVSKWAETSNDHNGWSLAIQQIIGEEFGVDDALPWEVTGDTATERDRIIATHRPKLAAFVHAQYQLTQERLEQAGIDTLQLARGMHWDAYDTVPEWARKIDGTVDSVEIPLRPASSFTADGDVAAGFAQGAFTGDVSSAATDPSLVIAATVPRERILATPRTGVGCLGEFEFVVLGGSGTFSAVGSGIVDEADEPLSDHDLGWMRVEGFSDEEVLRALTLKPDDKRRRELMARADALGIQVKALPTGDTATPAGPTDADVRNEDWIKTVGWDVRDYDEKPITTLAALAARLGTDEDGAREWLRTMPAGEAAPRELRREAGLKGGKRESKGLGMDFDEEIKAAVTAEHDLTGAALEEFNRLHARGVHGRFAHTWQHVTQSHVTRDRTQVIADVLGGSGDSPIPTITWKKHLDGFVSDDGNYYIERRIAGNRLYVRDPDGEEITDGPFPRGRVVDTGPIGDLRTKAEQDKALAVHSEQEGRSDESAVRSDGGSQLAAGRPGSGGDAAGSGDVLRGAGDGSAAPDRSGDGREPGTGGGDVRAASGAAVSGAADGGGDRGAGAPDGSAAGRGDAGPVERRTDPGGRGSGVDGGAAGLAGRSDGVGADEAAASDLVTEADQPAPDPSALPGAVGGTDFTPTSMDDLAPAGKAAKLKGNLEALRTLRMLQEENRPATPEEQATLARWAGWGGLPEVFDPRKPEYAAHFEELSRLLSPAEIREARRNTLNAHYTDARVVENVWRAVGELGFDGGRVLEPGSGSGTFIGFAPGHAAMVGVELDSTTAAISQYLYPSASIRNESFADTNVPDGSFDATIGNVPFGNFALTDPEHNPTGESIHNHFILKSLALTRPGGIVAVLTSRYTLDSEGSRARQLMADRADLIGAVRLPSGSHQRASGTDVIEDVLIFRVREPGEAPHGDQSWVTSHKQDIDGQTISVNDYWAQHPDHVLGEVHAEKGRFGTGDMIVRGDRDMADLPATMDKIVADAKRDGLTGTPSSREALPDLISPDRSRHEGHIRAEDDGTFTQAVGGASRPHAVADTQAEELRGLIGLRDNLTQLLAAEAATAEDTPQIEALRHALNARYDAYVEKYGPINRFKLGAKGQRIRPKQGDFRSDPMSAIVRALEEFDPVSQDARKADVFSKRAVAPRELRTTADNPKDALALSMESYGEVNLPAIAKMLGTDEADAREQLGDLVFEQPPLTDAEQAAAESALSAEHAGDLAAADAVDLSSIGESVRDAGKIEPAVAYLSGNVRRKLAAARAAATHDPRFRVNVEALERVIPPDLGPEEIDGRIGASWIDAGTIEAFMREILNERYSGPKKVQVAHSGGSIWTVVGPRQGILATQEWGTPDRPTPELINALLEQRSIQVTREVTDPVTGKSRYVPDLEATLAAQEKAEQLQERFGEWIWEDPDRARRLQAVYNDKFNALVLRKYEADPDRVFPGMSPDWHPFEHVKSAAERITQEPTVLLAHVVGAGKTSEMAMGAAELRRLGLARKPAIVIPNHMLEQFSREFLQIYPQAKILAAGTEDLKGDKRREFVARAATGDWDAVILTQSAFNAIPMSKEQMQAYIDREMETMRRQLEDARATEGQSPAQQRTVKKMETALLRAEEALKKKLKKRKDVGVSFEQTGIDYLMVDEAHMYSNLRVLSNVRGAGNTGSDRATDLHMKLEYLRANSSSGRVATFATGTPIRNTVTQAYVMQRFLRPDLLEDAGIHTFDQWAGTFGQLVTEMELKPEGIGFRQTERFARFRNVPELLQLFHMFADVKMAEDLDLPTPNLKGGKMETVVVPASPELRAYVAELGDRADDVRNARVAPEEDNMLKISGDGRKAALSMKLVGQDHQPGKIEAAADRIASIHKANADRQYVDGEPPGALQIVFLDMGTPKGANAAAEDAEPDEDAEPTAGSLDDASSVEGWDAYNKLKDELVARGMDPASIRFIHEAKNDAQKAEMFAAARNGRISVIIGSSEKMGVGTNIQKRAVALHHLDAPWRPADVEQRDGRIMRQGNLNPDVEVINYVTEHSFDAYMWQTLERKAKFIHQVMRGKLDVREIDDVGDTAMNWAEIKAVTTGNPELLEKAKADTALAKLTRLERAHARQQVNMRAELRRYESAVPVWTADADAYDRAIDKRVTTRGDAFTMRVGGQDIPQRGDAEAAVTEELQAIVRRVGYSYNAEPHVVGQLGGHDVIATMDWHRNTRIMRIGFAGVPGDVMTIPTHDVGELAVVPRLENALVNFETKRDRLREAIAKAADETGRIEARIGQPFPRTAELDELRGKVARLTEKMEQQMADAANPPLIREDEPTGGPPPAHVVAGLALATGGRAAGAEYRRDTSEDVPAGIELWQATPASGDAPVWLAFRNGEYVAHATDRASVLDELKWYQSHAMLT